MSDVGSVLQAGLNGVQKGLRNAQAAADDIARIGTSDRLKSDASLPTGEAGAETRAVRDPINDLAEASINLKLSELQVKASAKVVETADQMLGTLIDIKV